MVKPCLAAFAPARDRSGGDGETAGAVGGGRLHHHLQPYSGACRQSQGLLERDLGQPDRTVCSPTGDGLQGHLQERGAGQPDISGDAVVGQVGESAVPQVDLGLHDVQSRAVTGLDVDAGQRPGASSSQARGDGPPVALAVEGIGGQVDSDTAGVGPLPVGRAAAGVQAPEAAAASPHGRPHRAAATRRPPPPRGRRRLRCRWPRRASGEG